MMDFLLNPFFPLFLVLGIAVLLAVIELFKSLRIVPARTALVVERVGKYSGTLEAGFHVLVPFLDKVRYSHSLKEISLVVPPQPCFTEDNVRVEVGGVLYLMVTDPRKASYGINNYQLATIQLAQTMMRSVIGRLELDKTFEERDSINATLVHHLDEALESWGVKVTRYEIQTITPPASILKTMELQVSAERDKRAKIAKSTGEMNSRINSSVGLMEEAINRSEGEKQKQINEAEGQAAEILALSRATAASIEKIAQTLTLDGGEAAAELQLTEQYIEQLGKARQGSRVILPLDLTDLKAVRKSTDDLS
jgi:regulator of protease activity HflC (stomatin/prohibitin superfamily)